MMLLQGLLKQVRNWLESGDYSQTVTPRDLAEADKVVSALLGQRFGYGSMGHKVVATLFVPDQMFSQVLAFDRVRVTHLSIADLERRQEDLIALLLRAGQAAGSIADELAATQMELSGRTVADE